MPTSYSSGGTFDDAGYGPKAPPADRRFPNIHPIFAARLVVMFDKVGGLSLTSGYRSSQRQAELYDCWRRGVPGCNPANKPGTSNHEAVPYGAAMALAADLGGPNLSKARARAAEFGVHFPIAGEEWHCQPVEVPLPSWTGLPEGW